MQQSTQPFDATNFRDLLSIVFKHKYKILIAFLVIFLVTTFIAFKLPSLYEAKSVLLIKFGREYLLGPEETRAGSTPSVPPQTIISGEISILTSLDLFTRLVNKMGAVNLYPALSNLPKGNSSADGIAIQTLQANTSVRSIPSSSLIEVSFTHENPEMSAKVVNLLVDLFKEKHLEVFSGDGTAFLENQLEISQKKLSESESSLASFKQKNSVFSFEGQTTNLISQRSALDANLKVAQNQISELEQRIAFIKSPRWTADATPEMRSQLAVLQQREREFLEKYNEGSRTLQNLRQEMQALQDSIRKNTEELRRIELGRNEGELSVVKARADSLRRQLGQVEGEIRALGGRERDLQELKREAAIQEQHYQTYARKLEESLIADDMDRRKMVAISIVEKASTPMMRKKQKLDKKQMVAAGFFGGVAAGIAFAFFLEFMSPGMTTPMSAERRLGVPVMVAITKKE